MRYSVAITKLSKARELTKAVLGELDTALSPATVDDWARTVDQAIQEAYDTSAQVADLLSEVAEDIPKPPKIEQVS